MSWLIFRLIICCLVLGVSSPAWSATYYADQTIGPASCVGTYNKQNRTCTAGTSTAYKTIAGAKAVLAAGDTLYFRAGTWAESLDVRGVTGTPGHYITFAAYPGEVVTLTAGGGIYGTYSGGSYFIFDGFVIDGVNSSDSDYMSFGGQTPPGPSHDIIIRNNEIKNFRGNGIFVGGGGTGLDNIWIQNNRIHDQSSPTCELGKRWYGIYFHDGTNGLIEGNDVYNNPGGGMQLYPGIITNLTVRNNNIHDNNACTTSAVGGVIISSDGASPVTNVRFYDNLVYKNGSAGSHGTSPGIAIGTVNVSGIKIWNNTVYGNQSTGITVPGTTTNDIEIRNNIAFTNGGGNILINSAGTVSDHNLTTEPLFVNAAALDFHLQAASAAINTGVTLLSVTTDFDGVLRPQGSAYDIGAYEFGGAPLDTTPPAIPTRLQIR